ncbi:MAG: SMI1/KNR4 family protein [Tenacibaculum sp.]|nr:SMI1/KNR4 family protein [Tenacibaculum sp.]
MDFKDFEIIPNRETQKKDLFVVTNEEISKCEKELNISFENDYKEYVSKYGRGLLGLYIRMYLPTRIVDELKEWRERIDQYWFWDDGKDVLTKEEVLKSIIIGDTIVGDEIIYYKGEYFILPREEENIYKIGKTLEESIKWLCSSNILIESFTERDFEPF